MKSIFIRNGLILFAVCLVIFLISRFFFFSDFLKATIIVNSFVFPLLFAVTAVISTLQLTKKQRIINFREGFSASYITVFTAGFLMMIFIYLYFNYIDIAAEKQLRMQWLQNIQKLPEKNKVMLEIENQLLNYKENIFKISSLIKVFIFTLALPFYGLLSILIALFFRKK